jgi:hypothetical protein
VYGTQVKEKRDSYGWLVVARKGGEYVWGGGKGGQGYA